MALSPFDFVKAISFSKENLFDGDTAEKDYNAFIINRNLSYFIDTVFHASEMDRNDNLPKKMQFEYYVNAITKKKRYSKWDKKIDNPDVELLMEYYKYPRQKVLEIIDLLSIEQIEFIKKSQFKGGK